MCYNKATYTPRELHYIRNCMKACTRAIAIIQGIAFTLLGSTSQVNSCGRSTSCVVVGVFLGQIVVVTALPLGQKSISGAIGNNTSAEKGEKWAWLIEQLRVRRKL